MPVNAVLHYLCAIMALALSTAALPAQEGKQVEKVELKYVDPTKFERATKADDQGLLQWDTFKAENCPTCNGAKVSGCKFCERLDDNKHCPECKGTRKATCRACAGLGTWPDPLEKVHCPGCMGAAVITCQTCGGFGFQKVQGSGDKKFDCVACKGVGGFPCAVCNGARLVEVAALKPSLKEANAKELAKAQEQIDAVLKGLETFAPTGQNSRKEVKDLTAILQKGQAILPPLKRSPKALGDVMNKIYAGTVYVGHEEREANVLKNWVEATTYYLKHQKRIVELCLARADANAKVLADKKGKEE